MTNPMTTVAENSSDLLDKLTAADLMTPNPVSIRGDAGVGQATVLFAERGFSGAVVIDEAGRPIGVVSSTDLLIHDREKPNYVSVYAGDSYGQELSSGVEPEGLGDGYQVVDVDRTAVSNVMTPVVFSVAPDCSARKVVKELLALRVHRLFVVDHAGVLVGVVSTLDILKSLLR